MNTPSPNSLRLVSYNCRGWRSGSNYVKLLLQSCDLCFVQEHWLFREHLGSLNISNDFLSVGVSGMDSSEILVGRPFGGCGILYRKSLSPVIRRIFTSSQRLCAISLTLHNSLDNSPFAILFVCVYLPTDYSNVASHTAFAESIGELDGIISAENFDNIIIAGDFNTDLSRPGSNFTTLTSFMSSHKLVCVNKLYNIKFTYRKDDFSCFSSPDHILTYSNFSNLIDSVFTLDPVENFSDHLPLHFSLQLPDFLSFPCPRNPSVNSHCHPNHSHAQSSSSVNWFKVSPHHISSYCNHLSSMQHS